MRETEGPPSIDDVLDRLLDPLEEAQGNGSPPPADEAAAAPAPARAPGGAEGQWPPPPLVLLPGANGRGSLADFAARLRWSQRSSFRIPRLLARWAVLVAAFWSLIWLILR